MDQDEGVGQFDGHLVGVGDEVGADIAAVELHAFDDIQLGDQALGFFNGDDAFVADLGHGQRDHVADFLVAVRADRADLADFVVRLDLLGALLEIGHDGFHRLVNAALQVHRVHAGGNRLAAFAHDGAGQHGGGGGAVAGDVIGLAGDFAHHLGAHVFELVGQFDFLGDRHAVLGGARGTERLVDHDVAALGAQRHLHGVGEDVDAAQHLLAGVGAEFHVLGCHCTSLLNSVVWIGGVRRRPVTSWPSCLPARP